MSEKSLLTEAGPDTALDTVFGAYRVLSIDEDYVAVDKPEGHFVHMPEDPGQRRFVDPNKVVLSHLRRQLGQYLYPVHRLDVATSGVLIFALSKECARTYCDLQAQGRIEKTYELICRGWTEDQFQVNLPLELDSTQVPVQSQTDFENRARFEVDSVPGGKYPRSRYALLRAFPRTGRFHQIRRHLNRISRPIIGDNDHGDSRHNRYFRESFGIQGLCLRAVELTIHFNNRTPLTIQAPTTPKWQKIYKLIQATEVHNVPLNQASGTQTHPRPDMPQPQT